MKYLIGTLYIYKYIYIYYIKKKHIELYTEFAIAWILDINLTLYLVLFHK